MEKDRDAGKGTVTRKFVCEACGHKFAIKAAKAEDIYFPKNLVRCPACGSMHTRRSCLFGLNRWLYTKFWEDTD